MSLENEPTSRFPRNRNNLVVSKESENQLFLSTDKTNCEILERLDAGQLSRLGNILSRPGLIRVVSYFKDVRASTGQAAAHFTQIPESTVYREVAALVKLDFLAAVSVAKRPKGTLGGARPKIYGVRGVRPEEIAQAQLAHIRISSPIYSAVQMALPSFKASIREVNYREVLEAVRPYSHGFRPGDVAELVAQDLRGRGVTVWR